jgi:hypothetical protein
MKRAATLGLVGLCLGLTACGEKPQVAGTRSADQAPYATAATPFSAPDWKQGDATTWERNLNARAQRGQNEYGRTGPH